MEDFDGLIREYYSPLLSYIARACKSEQAAEDILQEVFLQLWRNQKSIPKDSGVRAYLYSVARHRMLDYLRTERRSSKREERYLAEEPISAPDAGAVAENEELARAIRAAVDNLPERTREVWRLNREQGLSYREVAEVLGISVNTVKTLMTRAGVAIREALVTFL